MLGGLYKICVQMEGCRLKDWDREWSIVYRLLEETPDADMIDRPFDSLDVWRTNWQENKAWAMPYLDDDGRLETVVEYEPDMNDVRFAFDHCLDIATAIASRTTYSSYKDDLASASVMAAVSAYLGQIVSSFSEREVINNRIEVPVADPQNPAKNMPRATRFTKYVARRLRYCPMTIDRHLWTTLGLNPDNRSDLQFVVDFINTVYSQVVQSIRTTSGKVVLSINPVDILLASAHTTKWTTCHNIFNGAYASGPVDYLQDACSMVAFAYTDVLPITNPTGFRDILWPRKIWRQMVYVDRDARSAVLSEEYPIAHPVYVDATCSLIASLFADIYGVSPNWSAILPTNESCHIDDDDPFFDVCEGNAYVVRTHANPWHYRDEITRTMMIVPSGRKPEVVVGIGSLVCPICGGLREHDYRESETLFCWNCRNPIRCHVCDATIESTDDVWYAPDDYYETQPYCEDCFLEHFVICSSCLDYVRYDDTRSDIDGNLLCERCFDAYCVLGICSSL